MTINDTVKPLSIKLDNSAPKLARLDRYWSGTQPAAFLSPKSRTALGNRLDQTSVNYCRLAIRSRVERLAVSGFRTAGPDSTPDATLWDAWRRAGMVEGSSQAETDALLYGRSFVIVWADSTGAPTLSVESAAQVSVTFDPLTREVTKAFKRWVDPEAKMAYAVLYEPDRITKLTGDARAGDPAALTATNWTTTEVIPNPLGVVPVVPLVNRGRLLELDGVSEVEDITGLVDALAKLLADSLVTSEYYARPRRWVTGLEVVEDDEGNPINPFSDDDSRPMQAESPETKFGQFDPASLDGYASQVATITQQIGALSGLPPHYLGLVGDQPASADAVRSAEASLVARCYSLQQVFGRAWAEVAKLVLAVRDGVDPRSLEVDTIWSSPETRTVAQDVDAAAKLVGIGAPLALVADTILHWSPTDIERLRLAMRQNMLDTSPATLAAVPQIATVPPGTTAA